MTTTHYDVHLQLNAKTSLPRTLSIPPDPQGLVIFAHGAGSSRMSPRNRHVSGVLQQAGFATLLFDLLTAGEERLDRVTGQLRLNVHFLCGRLLSVTEWVDHHHLLLGLHIGYFGASTGAAAALLGAAARPDRIFAVVSRSGRPELAGKQLAAVRAPTLLIVGGEDKEALASNESAQASLRCTSELQIVSGAGHLFEEPGAIEEVALLASEWFQEYLPSAGRVVDLRSRTALAADLHSKP